MRKTNLKLMIFSSNAILQEKLQMMAPENVRVVQVTDIINFIQLARLDFADVIMIDRDHPEARHDHLISFIQSLTSQMVTYFNPQVLERQNV